MSDPRDEVAAVFKEAAEKLDVLIGRTIMWRKAAESEGTA